MDLAVITFKQVFVLFLLMLAGVVCTRAGGVHPGDKRAFSDLLLNLVVPAMVVNSYLTEYNPSTGHNLLRAFGWSLLVLLAGSDGPQRQRQGRARFASVAGREPAGGQAV